MRATTTIALLVCATSVLTLCVVADTTTAASSGEPAENSHEPPKSTNKSGKNLANENTHAAPPTRVDGSSREDEAKTSSKIAPKTTVVAEGIKLTPEDLLPAVDAKSKLPKIRTASVVARKGAIPASKISPRKGVGPESLAPTASTVEGFNEAGHSAASSADFSPNEKEAEKTSTTVEKNNTKATERKSSTENVDPVNKENSTVGPSSTTPNSSSSSTRTNFDSTTETKIATSGTTTRRFKPKPTVTVGEMDIDKPIPASPTKTPPLGMPRKIDYIVPVIITIMALPLLGGAAFFLYRRGRDCWDKRHYRRMDFLIDGMYNDYSWK